ncbi:MAG TPA: biotin-dependent carboxyltransferase family protein [Opitutaceae bacterium]|nr:biotin-dependent carboxyltransferase family protein [Opitutaceae bacterium]
MARIHVLKPGMFTTVQDLGRPGWQRHGVTPGGAADAQALRFANVLVGNAAGAAGLEITLVGPTLRFAEASLVAIGGAESDVAAGGVRLPAWRPIRLEQGAEVAFGVLRTGCRSYLAVAGGIAVPRVLGGRGTHVSAGFGGLAGRALRAGDVLKSGPASAWARRLAAALAHRGTVSAARWEIGMGARPSYAAAPIVRVVRGAQWDWFSAGSRERFLQDRFTVLPRSDRMGLRLTTAAPGLVADGRREMVSEGVATGTVQVPPDGQPIVLLADRQTIGGYPKIANVASIDQSLLAQLRPGDTVGFREVSLAEAHELWLAAERQFATVSQGIALHTA